MHNDTKRSGRGWLYGCLGCGGALLLLLVVLVGCGALLAGGEGGSSGSSGGGKAENEDKAGDGSGGSSEEPAEEEPGAIGMGETGTVADWTVTVEGIETAATYGDQFMEETAQGEFKIVSLTVANEGDEATYFDTSAVSLRDADGKEYSSQTTLSESDLFLEQINPGNSASGEAVVDVPAGTEITQVVIEDAWSFTSEPLVVEVG